LGRRFFVVAEVPLADRHAVGDYASDDGGKLPVVLVALDAGHLLPEVGQKAIGHGRVP
jgi:hypothetical protein